MEVIDDNIILWEDMKNQYPNEWIVIGNLTFDGMKIVNGIVLAHHSDKGVAGIEGGEKREGF